MIQENEIVSLLLCLGILSFILINRLQIKRLPSSDTFVYGFYIFTLSRIFTVLEGFFFENFLNLLEHACYAISSLLLLIWFWNVFVKNERGVEQ